jgi:hypothetical protein
MRGDCLIANRNKMFYLLSALLLSRTKSNHSTLSSKHVDQFDFLTFTYYKQIGFHFKKLDECITFTEN